MSQSENVSIPIVDFASLSADKEDSDSATEFLETWDYAFRTFGFVCLINHGLEDKYRLLYAELQKFFQLSLQEKLKFRIAENYGQGGFIPQGQENVSRTFLKDEEARPADAVENLASSDSNFDSFPCIANGYHSDELINLSLQLNEGLEALTIKVMEIMARCLDLPSDFFLDSYKDGRAVNNLRAAHYLPVEKGEEGKQQRYGEHTDYTGFTFLWRGADNGLQCLNTGRSDAPDAVENHWIDIPILSEHKDALIVNAGDLIQRWTNDYWISNIHRVLGGGSTLDQGKEALSEPISIVYFTGPSNDTKISVLSQSPQVSSAGDINPEYEEEITSGEHLYRKLNASNE